VRTFGRALALGYPLAGAVPFSRKVAPAQASVSIALFSTGRFPSVLSFSLISFFSTSSDTKQRRRSADFADLNSKICVIVEICGSLSSTRITPESTDKTER
jgi:hypothetical protein